MAETIERPKFFEGQVVRANDLNEAVEHARDSLARHHRYLHTWGITTGLELTGNDRKNAAGEAYKEVTVSAGTAVDGTGREIVVPESERLSPDLFDELGVASSGDDPETWYPVFLLGTDREKTGGGAIGACDTGQATRVEERYELTFGRPGDQLKERDESEIDVDEGPGESRTDGWKILLGYVQWNGKGQFTDVGEEADGVGRRYAGVRADRVLSRGDKISVETDEMEVDGDLRVKGKILGALAGGVQVMTGVATDGMLLPLPSGITQDQVDSGEVVLQAHVTPHFGELAIPNLANTALVSALARPIECRADGRCVLCRIRWEEIGGAASVVYPGACDYTLMAFPSEANGGS